MENIHVCHHRARTYLHALHPLCVHRSVYGRKLFETWLLAVPPLTALIALILMHLKIFNLVVPLSSVEEKMFSIVSWPGLERRNRGEICFRRRMIDLIQKKVCLTMTTASGRLSSWGLLSSLLVPLRESRHCKPPMCKDVTSCFFLFCRSKVCPMGTAYFSAMVPSITAPESLFST